MQEKRWINRKFQERVPFESWGVNHLSAGKAHVFVRRFQIVSLGGLNGENLAAPIVAAGRTGDVSADTAATLRTFGELRRMPAVGRFASTQAHLRGLSFRNAHDL
jgi:hypothetical protein